MAENPDANNAPQQAQAQPAQYVFEPTQAVIDARIPARLRETDRADSGKNAQARPQRGMLCPRCHSTNTTFTGLRKVTLKVPSRNHANFQAQEWNCDTAEALRAEVPCLLCPVCNADNQLLQRITHVCAEDNNEEKAIKPGKTCARCGWLSNARCLCPECNRTVHPKSFFALLNHEAPENATAEVQRLPQGINSIENTWYYDKMHQQYQKDEINARRTNLVRMATFNNIQCTSQQALQDIVGDFGADNMGMKVVAELHLHDPNCLRNLGANPEFIRTVEQFATERGHHDHLHFDPQFHVRQQANFAKLGKAHARVGPLIFGMFHSIQRNGNFRLQSQADFEELRQAGVQAYNQANQQFVQQPANAPANGQVIPFPPQLLPPPPPQQQQPQQQLQQPLQGQQGEPLAQIGALQQPLQPPLPFPAMQQQPAINNPGNNLGAAAGVGGAGAAFGPEVAAVNRLTAMKNRVFARLRERAQAAAEDHLLLGDEEQLRARLREINLSNNSSFAVVMGVASNPSHPGHIMTMNLLSSIPPDASVDAQVFILNAIIDGLNNLQLPVVLAKVRLSEEQEEDPFAEIFDALFP